MSGSDYRDPIDSISACQDAAGRDVLAYGQSKFVGQWWTGAVCVAPASSATAMAAPVRADLRAGVGSVAWLQAPDRKGDAVVASGSDDGSVDLWAYSGASPVPGIHHMHGQHEHDDLVSCVSAILGSNKLASSSWDKRIIVWAALSYIENESTLRGHTDLVHSIVWGESPHALLSASQDRSVRLWDTREDSKATSFWLKQPAYCAAFVSDGNLIAAGDECGTLTLFDIRNNSLQLAHLPQLHKDVVRAIACSPAGATSMLVSCGDDGRVCTVPKGLPVAEERVQVQTPHARGAYVRGLAYGDQGLYCSSWTGSIAVLNSVLPPL